MSLMAIQGPLRLLSLSFGCHFCSKGFSTLSSSC